LPRLPPRSPRKKDGPILIPTSTLDFSFPKINDCE
jgi:hypothetical protein